MGSSARRSSDPRGQAGCVKLQRRRNRPQRGSLQPRPTSAHGALHARPFARGLTPILLGDTIHPEGPRASHQPEDSAEARREKSGERGQIPGLGTFFEITFFLTLAYPDHACWWLLAAPHSDCTFSVLFGEQRKGASSSHANPISPASQFGSHLRDLVFIYSIYLFIGSQDPRGWWRSVPAKRQPPATAALGSWARRGPGRWRWLSSALGCRAPGAADSWLWRCARWRSACSPTFGPPSCRPGCCAWKRSAGNSRWRKLFWDESTNCWTRFVPFVALSPIPKRPLAQSQDTTSQCGPALFFARSPRLPVLELGRDQR